MEDEIEWVDPPPSRQGQRADDLGKYVWFFNALRERPGEWAVFARDNTYSSGAQPINKGQLAGCAPGEFEAVTRTNAVRGYDIYVRYVGVLWSGERTE